MCVCVYVCVCVCEYSQLSCNSPHVLPSGVVTDARTICLHYVTSLGFVLDVLAVLPLELAALGWMGSEERWGYVALFRINRIAKVWKVKTQHSLVTTIINKIHIGLNTAPSCTCT